MYNNTKILRELIQYILDYCVESNNKRNIACKSIELLPDGTKIILINNRFFEHSKNLQDLFNIPSNNVIKNQLCIAFEEVFGPEFDRNLEIKIAK